MQVKGKHKLHASKLINVLSQTHKMEELHGKKKYAGKKEIITSRKRQLLPRCETSFFGTLYFYMKSHIKAVS